MITISSIVGNIFHDKQLAEKFEKLRNTENCELIKVSRSELDKTRLRRQTDKGTDVGLILNSQSRLHNGDVLISNSERLIVLEQMPEKVISIKTKKIEANTEEILVKLGHIIGNRHRPIQIEDGRIIFPILSDSEVDTFRRLFSSISNHVDIEVEERIFRPQNGMDVHEHQ